MRFSAKKSVTLFILPFMLSAFVSACNFWQSTDNSNSTPQVDFPPSSAQIPFSNKEPEIFQTEIVISNFINGQKTERKYFIAKNGNKFVQKFDTDNENGRTFLRTGDKKMILINHESKTYREISGDQAETFSDDSLIKNLTSKWLNEKTSATFEQMETENDLSKYRVNFEDANNSEVLIFVNENLKLPVRQEFYSVAGDKKDLLYSIELQNFKTETDADLFDLPENYRKIESKK